MQRRFELTLSAISSKTLNTLPTDESKMVSGTEILTFVVCGSLVTADEFQCDNSGTLKQGKVIKLP